MKYERIVQVYHLLNDIKEEPIYKEYSKYNEATPFGNFISYEDCQDFIDKTKFLKGVKINYKILLTSYYIWYIIVNVVRMNHMVVRVILYINKLNKIF